MAKRKAGKPKLQPKEQPALESRQRLVETVPYVLVLIGLPLFFAMLLHAGGAPGQRYLSIILLAAAFSAWYLRSIESRELPPKAPYLTYLFIYGCVLILSLIIWNYCFRLYISNVDFSGDIFRSRFRKYYAPIYGDLQIPTLMGYVYSLLAVGIFTTYLFKYRKRVIEEYSNLACFFFFVLFTVSMALTDNISRVSDWMAHYSYFAEDLSQFDGITELLQDYTLKMGQLGVHNNHYPPGILLTLKIEESLNARGLTRLMVMLSGLGTVWLLKSTGKMMGGADRCAQLAGFLFILSPGILVYATADPGYLVLFLASLTLFLFLKGLKIAQPAYALGMGVAFSVYTFFSFSSGFLALLLGIVFLVLWRYGQIKFSAGLTQISLSVIAFTGFYIALYYATGFNLLVCLREAIQNNAKQMSSGFDDGFRYLLRSTGAILAYLITAGIPISYLAIRRMVMSIKKKDLNNLGNPLAIGLGLCLLASGFSGFFFLETERIWLFFTPALSVAAAVEGERIYEERGFAPTSAMLLSSLLLSVVYELSLRPFSWR